MGSSSSKSRTTQVIPAEDDHHGDAVVAVEAGLQVLGDSEEATGTRRRSIRGEPWSPSAPPRPKASTAAPEEDVLVQGRRFFLAFAEHNTVGEEWHPGDKSDAITLEQLQALLEGIDIVIPLCQLELLLAELGLPERLHWEETRTVLNELRDDAKAGTLTARTGARRGKKSHGLSMTMTRPSFVKAFLILLFFAFTFPFIRVSRTVRVVTLQLFHAFRVPLSILRLLLSSSQVTSRTYAVGLAVWLFVVLIFWGVADLALAKTLAQQLRTGCMGFSPPEHLNCTISEVPGFSVSALERQWCLYIFGTICIIVAARSAHGSSVVLPAHAVLRKRQGYAHIPCTYEWYDPARNSEDKERETNVLYVLGNVFAVDIPSWEKSRATHLRWRSNLAVLLPLPAFAWIYYQRLVWGVGHGGKTLFGMNTLSMAVACVTSAVSAYFFLFFMFYWLGEVYQTLERKRRYLWNLRSLIEPDLGACSKSCAIAPHTRMLLPMTDARNVAAWRHCREFVIGTGSNELREANVHLGGALTFLLLLLVYIAVMRVARQMNEDNALETEDNLVLLGTAFLALLVLGGYMLYPSLFTAVAVNDEHRREREDLERTCFDVSVELAEVRSGSIIMPGETMGESERRITDALELVRQLVQYMHFKNDKQFVLGIPLDRRFVASVTTLLFSGIVAALSNLI